MHERQRHERTDFRGALLAGAFATLLLAVSGVAMAQDAADPPTTDPTAPADPLQDLADRQAYLEAALSSLESAGLGDTEGAQALRGELEAIEAALDHPDAAPDGSLGTAEDTLSRAIENAPEQALGGLSRALESVRAAIENEASGREAGERASVQRDGNSGGSAGSDRSDDRSSDRGGDRGGRP